MKAIKEQENNNYVEETYADALNNAIISISENMENETMPTKFYNFQCINLYGYIDYAVAMEATQAAQLNQPINNLINTPIELYETPNIARLLTPTTGNRQLMAFAVWVQNSIYDEFDLSLSEKIKTDGRKPEEIKKSVNIIRSLKFYKTDERKKAKPYISYIVQNQNVIKQIFPCK